MALDSNALFSGGMNSVAVILIGVIARNLKGFVRLSQTQWERNMDARVTKIEVVVDDCKKENIRQAVVITDLTKRVDTTMTKVDSTCQKLIETAAPISNLTPAFKNFVEKVQTRLVHAETEIIQLARDVKLIRDKK